MAASTKLISFSYTEHSITGDNVDVNDNDDDTIDVNDNDNDTIDVNDNDDDTIDNDMTATTTAASALETMENTVPSL